MARTRRRLTPAEAPASEGVGLPAILEKARAVAARTKALRGGLDGAYKVAQQAQVREALTRSELTLALHAALAARAETEARLREQALAAWRKGATGRLRRHGRPSQLADRVLVRLGSFGQAAVIARSGVWRGSGSALHDLRHMAAYARRRANPGVAPQAFLDQAWYLAANPDVAAADAAPLVQYLLSGGREDRDPHPLFHSAWYRAGHAAEIAATSVTPLEHYARVGAARGDAPHPAFDVGHYLAQGAAPAPGEDPASHYVREGAAAGLSPHPLFDPAWYQRQAGTTQGARGLVHYLTEGWRRGLSPHPLFDPAWYLAAYPELAAAGVEPLTHFLTAGAGQGLSPGPWFDLPAYVAQRGAALAAGVNPLVDYLRGGAWAVAEPKPGHPTAAYLASEPELARQGLTPLEHWARKQAR
jgi:hypothetical protein